MEVSDTVSEKTGEQKSDVPFKKPILIGKIGRLPKKICSQNTSQENKSLKVVPDPDKPSEVPQFIEQNTVPTEKSKSSVENEVPLAYNEPSWSGLPKSDGKDYTFEVLKNGSIIETVNLMSRPFWVFGRLAGCNICMQHPTISRYHAVLQYRDEGSNSEPAGFYIYDLGSTHGTFLNKNRLKPKLYTRIQVGHMLKLGCSTRSYILNGPEYDEEEESELSVTELKQKRVEEMRKFEEEKLRREQEIEEKKRREEERGIDWGIGEDADEETDLSENPFARTTNEDLYLDDPKKALRGFFEREGLDLEYDCNEHGMGQFLCKVELPVDDELGRPIVAEVLHKGKKKEAVVQCALEACRILDRFGVLRQATHESRKRKVKNWEENDYYDSDDDTFLDRTGTIEKKREKRMQAKLPAKAETYETLLEKEKSIASSIAEIERQLNAVQYRNKDMSSQSNEEDSLETFMKELKDSKPDKQTVSKLKLEITRLKIEHANVIRLVNIAKPASLPPLVAQYSSMPSTSKDGKNNILPIIGKRKKIKLQLPIKLATEVSYEINDMDDEEDDEEEKSSEKNEAETEYRKEKYRADEKVDNQNEETSERLQEVDGNLPKSTEDLVPNLNVSNEISPDPAEASYIESMSSSSDDEMGNVMEFTTIKSLHNTMTFKKFENILKKGLPPFADKYQEKLEKILNKLKKLATNEDRMHVDWKMLAAKKRKVMKLISDLKHCEPNERLEHKVSSELNRILTELNNMTEQKYKVIDKVKKMGDEIKNISHAINKDFRDYQKEIEAKSASEQSQDSAETTTDEDRKKKKNQRRIQQRQERAQMERQRGYEEDAGREDYSMWLPPTNQTGDGRTNLNDKYGY